MLSADLSKALSTSAVMVLLIWLSAKDTDSATEAPAAPKEAATETAVTVVLMVERSCASTTMAPSTSTPLPVVLVMAACVCEPTWLLAAAPAPLSATPAAPPPARATEPETICDSMVCAVSALTLRSSVSVSSSSAVMDALLTEAMMRLAEVPTRCFHFLVSA